ncbi:MAG: 2-C-methyl-D-erythritol 2,4-cyclodiphosphate synthase [Leucothrix sp.]
MDFRIGHGYDVHAFMEGSHITLGGVVIPHDRAFKAHSDGDVLLHATCDALLGSLALGDIGQHFPDTASQYQDIDSRILLRHVYDLVKQQGFALQNLDAVILAESPKLADHIDAMRRCLAEDLAVDVGRVGVKATTTEGLGYVGNKEGIAVSVTVLVYKS